MYRNAEKLLTDCQETNRAIWEVALASSLVDQNQTEEELISELLGVYQVMKDAATQGQKEELHSVSGLLRGNAKRVHDHRTRAQFLPEELVELLSSAISTSEVNAAMGKIVASPTAGAAGILPACLLYWQKKSDVEDREMIKGLLTASQIGAVIMHRANVSGAEGGCQAETGSAAAMSAAALVELSGGTPEEALNAAGFAIVNVLGLVCDPIGGRVEYPCFMRNANGVLNELGAAEMALAGVQSFAKFDNVVVAMQEVGDSLPPSLRETGLGGIARHCDSCFK